MTIHPDEPKLADWVRGKLAPAAKAKVDDHLSGCAECCEYLASLGRAGAVPTRSERSSGAPDALGTDPTVQRSNRAPQREGAAELEDTPIAPGTSIGRYMVLSQLGAGGMGRVFGAYDPELDRKVAIKLLRTDLRGVSKDELRTRLLREAQAMARISHPNIIAVFDVGTFQSQVFVAMELVVGRTLSRWLKEKSRSWREVVDAYRQAARGLAAAHAAGLIHRDFKPDNVLMGDDGKVRVLDFGLARSIQAPVADAPTPNPGAVTADVERPAGAGPALLAAPLTQAGVLMGTPSYMAPEQYQLVPADARTDQFSFCVALYEGLYGVVPFRGRTIEALKEEITTGQFPEPPKDRRVPGWLRAILRRGLSIDPNRRFPTMDSLLEALGKDPAVRARRALGVSASLVTVGALFGGLAAYHQRARTVCHGAEQRLAGIWDPARKDAIRSAFLTTSAPFATTAWVVTERMLDGYAQGWVAMRTEACEATRVRGEQSEELLDLRMQCLDRRRNELSALSTLLAQASSKVVEESVGAAQSLTHLDTCANAQVLRASSRIPEDPQKRAGVDAVRARLASVKALGDTGQVREALSLVKDLEGQARRGEYAPLLAEVMAERGDLDQKAADERSAQGAFLEAAATATEAREDDVAAHSLVELSLVAFLGGRPEEALSWAQLGQGAIRRLGGDDRLQARLHHILGLVYQSQGRYADALNHLQKCLTLREHAFGGDTLVVASSATALASGLQASGQLDEAIRQNERAVEIREKAVGPKHPSLAVAYDSLASALEAKGDLEGAAARRVRALEVLREAYGERDPIVATELQSMARLELLRGHAGRALELSNQAIALLEQSQGPTHPKTAEAVVNRAEVEAGEGLHGDAIADYSRALEIDQKALGEASPRLAVDLTGIGQEWLALGSHRKAVGPLERALQLLDSASASPLARSQTRFVLAQALWSQGRNRRRATDLAVMARDAVTSNPRRTAEIDRWLDAHR